MAAPFQALLERMTQAICRGDASYAFAYPSKMAGCEGRRARLGFADERILKSVRKWAGG